uniref:Cadherin domain-containing protein n=1 Tax=Caenorhabditis japonica TaxID=281687 RepID=A0A8R1EIH3_CAEJA
RILIHVDDINDNAPQFTQSSYFVKIPENQPSGSRVLRVVAKDRDLNPELLYHFLDAETETLPFRVDVASGWITVAGKVDREETDRYEITVVVTDGKTNRTSNTTCLVTILIEDVNDNPPVIENQNLDIFVRADVAEGDLLHVIDAHDADQQDQKLNSF